MGRSSRFAQMLDEKLGASEGIDERVAAPVGVDRRTLAHPLLFAAPYRPSKVSGYAAKGACLAAQRRTLAVPEQHALTALVRLGARLTPDFTTGELRHAFRLLAREYHPDRHPSSDQREQAQLARVFGEIVEHHRQLTTAATR